MLPIKSLGPGPSSYPSLLEPGQSELLLSQNVSWVFSLLCRCLWSVLLMFPLPLLPFALRSFPEKLSPHGVFLPLYPHGQAFVVTILFLAPDQIRVEKATKFHRFFVFESFWGTRTLCVCPGLHYILYKPGKE